MLIHFVFGILGVMVGMNIRSEMVMSKYNRNLTEIDQDLRKDLEYYRNLSDSLKNDLSYYKARLYSIKQGE
jgi:hypothetical protein